MLGSGRTTGVCPTSRVGVRRFCTHARAGVAWCPCLCWTALTVCALSFVCLDSRPSKENRRPSEHEDGPATGRRRALLVCATACYHLLFPVKTGKDRGENGGSVCWLQVRLCLTVTLLARNNRPFQGVTHGGVLGVIFITFFFFFYKAQHGMLFPAVDTALGRFCLQNSAAQHRERLVPCLLQFYWPRAAHGCGLCLRREVLFDTELIMKARHSSSLDDPQTFLTILFPSG